MHSPWELIEQYGRKLRDLSTVRLIELSYPKPNSYKRVNAVKYRYLTGFQLPSWYDHGKRSEQQEDTRFAPLHELGLALVLLGG